MLKDKKSSGIFFLFIHIIKYEVIGLKNKNIFAYLSIVVFLLCITLMTNKIIGEEKAVLSSSEALNNIKIGWGIKRNNNNEQPDLGSNKELLKKYNGISIGNKEKPYIYLTFDSGYEAGYTNKILDTLKEKNVKATFFITAHYLNTATDLVKRMVDEGHIIRKSYSKS